MTVSINAARGMAARIRKRLRAMRGRASENGETNTDNDCCRQFKDFPLSIEGGSVASFDELRFADGELTSTGRDPRITIVFDEPVSCVELSIHYYDRCNDEVWVYYARPDECFDARFVVSAGSVGKTHVKKTFIFPAQVAMIRIDPSEKEGPLGCREMKIVGIREPFDDFVRCALNDVPDSRDGSGCVVCTHDLSKTGAPILAFNIAKRLAETDIDVVVIALNESEGYLVDDYGKLGIPLVNYSAFEVEVVAMDYADDVQSQLPAALLGELRRRGYTRAFLNTIVSGSWAKYCSFAGINVVSLIHEMKTSIETTGFISFGKDVASYADAIVFPDERVANDFALLFPEVHGEVIIRHQGVYFDPPRVDDSRSDLANETRLTLGAPADAALVLCSGSFNFRKGVDLFVSAALMLKAQEAAGDRPWHFVWAGGDGETTELGSWLRTEIRQSGAEDRFHWLPFIEDPASYCRLLRSADVYWNVSREDPFPSVILEAMKESVPVVAFENTGGASAMLDEGRGGLIHGYDLGGFVEMTRKFLVDSAFKNDVVRKAKRYIDGEYSFSEYVDDLLRIQEGLVRNMLESNERRVSEGQIS